MPTITKHMIQAGVYWIEIPEADLRILCGCPADAIKHLIKEGFVTSAEKNGVSFETGPNAVLLSDRLIQNGCLSNLSEFPVLHMFYNQGMLVPRHPNNTGVKPILIGEKKQVDNQMKYVYRGNYGLISENEYLEAGESKEFAQQNIKLKLRFARGRFSPPEELMDAVYVERKFTKIRSGARIRKLEDNIFEIRYRDDSVTVDLNLRNGRIYHPSYKLPKVRNASPHFGIVHIGEGNGWDQNSPCAGSLIVYKDKHFLVDAGPNILYSLRSLGIKPTEIEGIFFTHVHDDHFAGLYSLLSKNPDLRIYSTKVILSTIIKKYSALFGLVEREAAGSFRFLHRNLLMDQWNECYGMYVKPILSPHSIDTTIFVFRAKKDGRLATYGHFSDITALNWLKKMIVCDENSCGITKEYFEYAKKNYRLKLTVKKIDVGGPVIHGDERDFIDDRSGRLVLAHVDKPLTAQQKQVGDKAAFGEMDTLIA